MGSNDAADDDHCQTAVSGSLGDIADETSCNLCEKIAERRGAICTKIRRQATRAPGIPSGAAGFRFAA
jgi:hypothetical protein